MHLNVIPSKDCDLHQIRIPKKLRQDFNLDFGDWLIFDTNIGPLSVMVVDTFLEDTIFYGDTKAFVSDESPILDSFGTDVYIERHKVTLGADPEFFILSKNSKRVIEAHRLLPHKGRLGNDGDLAELRPDYAISPEQLTINIQKLIKKIPKTLPTHLVPYASSWYAYRCCGFHIHLGMPIELLSYAAEQTDLFIKNFVAALDYFVGIYSAYLDTSDERRLSNEYGKPGDYRLSMRTLEYRTPGGFHLKTPAYTLSLLSIAYTIASEILEKAEEMSGGWVDMHDVVSFKFLQNIYDIPEKPCIREILCSNNRRKINAESVHVYSKLKKIMGEDFKNVVYIRKSEQPLYEEWLGNAT